MKRNPMTRIILFSILTVILFGLLIGGIKLNHAIMNTDWLAYLHPEYSGDFETLENVGSVPADQIHNIRIEWAAGSISVIPADVDTIQFSEDGGLDQKNQLVWSRQGDTLVIRYCETRVYFGISVDIPKDLLIQVPQDWVCEELEIDAASAAVQITDLTVDEISFDSASGACSVENCHVNTMDMNTASGDIRLTGTLQKLDCDAVSASCTLELSNTPKRIDADMVSGDLRLILPEDCGFMVSLEALSGDFTSEFPTTTSNNAHIYGDQRCIIDVSAVSGDVIIEKGSAG